MDHLLSMERRRKETVKGGERQKK